MFYSDILSCIFAQLGAITTEQSSCLYQYKTGIFSLKALAMDLPQSKLLTWYLYWDDFEFFCADSLS